MKVVGLLVSRVTSAGRRPAAWRGLVALCVLAGYVGLAPVIAGAQQPHQPSGEPAAAHAPSAHAAEGEHEGGNQTVAAIARLVNFALLVGTLVYFLRSPIATYLRDRGVKIRGDLARAGEMRAAAAADMAAIDTKMAALPGELAALKASGDAEAVAEEARIRQGAEAERQRLVEQSKREIVAQTRVAQRDLLRHAADLATSSSAWKQP
jgi:F0F1-type ATP synthase membrane subunit b/b'